MSTDRVRHACALPRPRQSKQAVLAAVGAVGLALALAIAASPVAARPKSKTDVEINTKLRHKEAERKSKEPFGNIPKGPLQIIISTDQQKLHLYSDGEQVAEATIATGVPEHPTPLGVFSVIDKERYHESNIYSGAPMPFMQRITWSGVAMHEGVGLGHPASHGCIRMPGEFAERLWALRSLGARVIIARPELSPHEFADPHLFVHKERPPTPAPAASIETVKTAQTVDSSKTTDATAMSMLPAATSDAGKDALRGGSTAPTGATPTPTSSTAQLATNISGLAVKPADPAPVRTREAGTEVAAAAADPAPAQLALPASIETGKPAASAIDRAAKPSLNAALEVVPVPIPKPADLLRGAIGAPIAIFVSRKTGKIYVRQHFAPLFDAPITIEHPNQPLGTHVFTAMEYLADGSTFRWNVISFPGEPPKEGRSEKKKPEASARGRRRREPVAQPVLDPAPPQTPRQALARIEIPQDVIDRISELMVSGSSLVISDQGLGEETGEGTDFIVVTR